jgi:hypothetical protein
MSHRRLIQATAGLVTLLVAGLPCLFGQDRTKIISISRLDNPPLIDGRIEDACWKTISPVSGFFQYDPLNGTPASEETLAWAAYDQNNLYFAFLMKDSHPERIWAELTPRNDYENNDSITLILDTYHDNRTSISFTVNPKGVQKNSVETIWKSEATLGPDGWAAEMAVPFKSLRFSPTASQVWGVNFERYLHRLNETDYWTDVSRDKPLLQQMGDLQGLAGIRPGYNLEFFPYAGLRSTRWDGTKDDKFAAGLDIKYGILPNLYLDVTASPDFSEVESDPFLYQLSPYENYFQENRPFFTEGSRYFQMTTEGEFYMGPDVNFFYSRRIGNPRIAAKLSGKTGGYAFGILAALNEGRGGDELFSVVRLQKDIFQNSQAGFYYAGMSAGSDYNRNIAVDYSFNFNDIYYVRGSNAFTFNKDAESKNNGLHLLQFQREPDAGLQLTFNFQRIEKNVRVRTGYINRTDAQSEEMMAGYAWRFNRGAVKRFSLDLTGVLEQDSGGRWTGSGLDLFFWTEFFSLLEIHGGLETGKSKYQVLDHNDELTWTRDPIKTTGGNLDVSWERGGFLKKISLEGGWEKRGIYKESFTGVEPGSQTNLEASLALRPLSNIEWSVSSDWIRQTLDRTGEEVFDGLTYSTALHFQITRSLFLSTRLLGETRENQYNLDVLLGYYFGAGNIVQLSYKKSTRTEAFGREEGHSLTLKVSYLLRI